MAAIRRINASTRSPTRTRTHAAIQMARIERGGWKLAQRDVSLGDAMQRMQRLLTIFLIVMLHAATQLHAAMADSHSDADPTGAIADSVPDSIRHPIPRGPLPQSVTPRHYRIDLTLLPENERYSGETQIRISLAEPAALIWLHGNDLAVSEAYVLDAAGRRMAARYAQVDPSGIAKLSLPQPLAAGAATLVFRYDAPFRTADIDGLARIETQGRHYAVSELYPADARRVFPSFDEPRFKTPFDVTITTRRGYVAITNSPEIRSEPVSTDLQRVTFATSKPLSTYLLTFAAGDFDVVSAKSMPPNAVRDRPIPLRGVAVRGKGAKLRYALENTAGILSELETYFGVPYPYDKLDLLTFPNYDGAMESAAAITYGESVLLMDEKASLIQKREYAYVHAHELSHQWFGNLVTPSWWDDLWLNESFATWIGHRTTARWAPGRDFDRDNLHAGLSTMDQDSRIGARALRLPVAAASDMAASRNILIYSKGNAVLAMFEGYAGADAFRRGVQLYMHRFPFAVVRAEDFLRTLEEGSRSPGVAQALRSFIDQPGVPLLSADWRCNGNALEVDLAQSRSLPLGSRLLAQQRWTLPVCIAYDQAGARQKRCTLLGETHRKVTFPIRQCPRTVMPNAEGTGYYRYSVPPQRFAALLDEVPRLDAAEALVLEDSLAAEVAAGRMDAATYLAAVPTFARHSAWDVAIAPLPRLEFFLRHLVRDDERAQGRLYVQRVYEPRLRQIGLTRTSDLDRSNPDEATLLRNELVPFLALDAHSESLRRELLAMGRAYSDLGVKGNSDAQAVDPALVETALAVAVQDLGMPFVEHLWARLQSSTDAVFRRDALLALARAEEPKVASWVRDHILSPELAADEAWQLYTRHAELTSTEALWAWQKDHLPQLAQRVSPFLHGMLISTLGGACSVADRARVQAAFAPMIGKFEGGQRALEDALEQIEICAAYADRQRSSIRSFKLL
jgi:cytosol alanyl aminopeptidase